MSWLPNTAHSQGSRVLLRLISQSAFPTWCRCCLTRHRQATCRRCTDCRQASNPGCTPYICTSGAASLRSACIVAARDSLICSQQGTLGLCWLTFIALLHTSCAAFFLPLQDGFASCLQDSLFNPGASVALEDEQATSAAAGDAGGLRPLAAQALLARRFPASSGRHHLCFFCMSRRVFACMPEQRCAPTT